MAFDKYRMDLNDAELDSLLRAFASEHVHSGPVQHVKWRQFCDEIDSVFTQKQLEKAPMHTVVPRALQRQLPQLSAPKQARMQELIRMMRQRFQIRRVLVKPFFDDFARHQNSAMMIDHVTRQQFLQCLSRLGVELSQDDAELIFEQYNDDANGSVNYVAFCRDADTQETYSMRTAAGNPLADKGLGGFHEQRIPTLSNFGKTTSFSASQSFGSAAVA